MRIRKFSRPGVILMATVVVIITSMVVANATQSLTKPNAAFISYSLAAGANSAPITPVTNKSVLIMACVTTYGGLAGNYGVGQVSLLHSPGGAGGVNHGMVWAGYNAWNSGYGTTTTGGISSTAGDHIVYIDSSRTVDIQTASADTILIHAGGNSAAGNVTLVW